MTHELNYRVFDGFPVLRSRRLTLRALNLKDAHEIYQMRSNGRVNAFIARSAMSAEEDAEALIERTLDAWTQKKGIAWSGILRDGKSIIGACGFNGIDAHNLRAEIGGELSADFWGKNIAAEAVEAIVAFGFDEMNLNTIEAKVSPANRGAIYLLSSLGFVKEAHFKERIYFNGLFSDMAVYTLHRERYGKNK